MQAVKIRPYRPSDAEALHAAALESIDRVFPWLPWCHPGYSLQEAQAWTRRCAGLFDRGIDYEFAIVGEAGRFLGGCGLNQLNPAHRFANLGYWVRTSEAGRGVATAAVRQLAAFAFEKTDLVRLEIVCATGNHASHRVARKAGATEEGTLHDRLLVGDELHDAVMFSIVRSKWATTQPSHRPSE